MHITAKDKALAGKSTSEQACANQPTPETKNGFELNSRPSATDGQGLRGELDTNGEEQQSLQDRCRPNKQR